MKAIYTIILVLLCTHLSFSNSVLCPDPPINDDPCIESDNPPLDLTDIASHLGNTCCARGPQDENPDGTPADWENVDCSAATQDAAVWYYYTPNPSDDGYTVSYISEVMEGPASVEIFSGTLDAGCTGTLSLIESKCNTDGFEMNIGNCFESDEVIFIKVTTDDSEDNCGTFGITIVAAECDNFADECGDLNGALIIQPITNPNFQIDYGCFTGCLDFACPESDGNGGCSAFTQMPTVWFQVQTDEIAAQMFTTVESNGNWTPIWSIYSGPDCDNLSIINYGGSPPCSNGDNTPELHQTSVYSEEQNYWIAITVDPESIPSEGIENGTFELCVATTVNAIICLGELEGGACDDESLVMEIVDRENEGMPLDGPFCPGEEVTVNISFFYDATESGADWFIGFVPTFGEGWDMDNFDFEGNAPIGNGQIGIWYEEGTDLAPIIQEPNPILCTYRDENGVLQLCNQLCAPCSECETLGMLEGDPLPSGYFWVTSGGNAGCDNDGSPGEGWGVGSTTAQIDWTFSLKVANFSSNDACNDNNDLSISFQTFSDGVAGCWEDPVGECILDRAMFSPAWEVGCNDLPPPVIAENSTICTKSEANIEVETEDGSNHTIE
ncbi:MAG: hypothetical protein P1U56_20365, partial [Saprospiraceae bacterium]|nr:hypothetical protein [Saprospiraceae bacterium]